MAIPILTGVTARPVTTPRLTTRVLFTGPAEGIPVLFLHGNLTSATWWEEVMLALPPVFQGIAPDQRGYGEADPAVLIDATRGPGDLADDAIALMDHLGIERFHVVGHSLGSAVVWRLLMDHAPRLLTVTQVAPGSPYGFGGIKGADGQPCTPDYAGSGAGLINPEFLRLAMAGDRSAESRFSPRNALRALVVKPPFVAPREEDLLSSMLSTHWGDRAYPGDAVPSTNWPGMAPGQWGPNNMLSPRYAGDVAQIINAEKKPPVLWVRGDSDLVVSDSAASDPGFLGSLGVLPDWPGAEAYPPQPMLLQTRTVLDRYARAGGSYEEVVIEDCGHSPYIEKPSPFNAVFHQHLG